MNTLSNVAGAQPSFKSALRPLVWSVRREVWENRSIYIAPLAAASLFLVGFVVHTIVQRRRMHGVWPTDPVQLHDLLTTPYEIAAGLIMAAAFLMGILYSLDALYGERRDRSILLWKSLPVSDLTAVLAKLSVPLVLLPLLSFAITVVAQFLMLVLSSLVLLGSGLSISTLWTHSEVFSFSLMLLYHIVTVHGLWYAPIYGWLLLVSAWAPRAPVLWAFMPPFVIWGMEKIAFNTSHFFNLLLYRLSGPEPSAKPSSDNIMDVMAALSPGQFFSEPGLWAGLALAALFLAGAVRLRRYRGPI